jgi:hypothetical protein
MQVLILHQQSLQLFKPLALSESSVGSSVITHQITTPVSKPWVLGSRSNTLSAGFDVLVMLLPLLLESMLFGKYPEALEDRTFGI